jgi:hypothetical protein
MNTTFETLKGTTTPEVVTATGKLNHHFHDPYWANWLLEFREPAEPYLIFFADIGCRPKIDPKYPNVIFFTGDGEQAKTFEKWLVANCQTEPGLMNSLRKSIDFGETFKANFPKQ